MYSGRAVLLTVRACGMYSSVERVVLVLLTTMRTALSPTTVALIQLRGPFICTVQQTQARLEPFQGACSGATRVLFQAK